MCTRKGSWRDFHESGPVRPGMYHTQLNEYYSHALPDVERCTKTRYSVHAVAYCRVMYLTIWAVSRITKLTSLLPLVGAPRRVTPGRKTMHLLEL